MIEVLIVDDEIHAVRGLLSSVPWDEIGVDKVHSAYNIRQAKEILDTNPVDIVISDIEMPLGDGMELLSWIRDHRPSVVRAFLTCHAEFEYARKAVSLGAMAYLLKPARPEELEFLIRAAVGKIESDRLRETDFKTYRRYHELWSANQPLLIERFWLDLLDRNLPASAERIGLALKDIDAGFSSLSRFIPILVSIQRWQEPLSQEDARKQELAMKHEIRSFLSLPEGQGVVIALKTGILLALFPENEAIGSPPPQLRQKALAFIDHENKERHCDLCCYLAAPSTIAAIPDAVDALLSMDRNNITAKNKFFTLEGPVKEDLPAQVPEMFEWAEFLLGGEGLKFVGKVKESLQKAARSGELNAGVLEGFRKNVMQIFHFILARKGLTTSALAALTGSEAMDQAAGRSVSGLIGWVEASVAEIQDALAEADKRQSQIGKVQAFISEHLLEDVSRDSLAKRFFISPDHLTRLFKKETGLSVSGYLIKARVDAAKEMLVHSDIPIGEIVAMLGYRNFSYFSKIFKRETGIAPHEFRRMKPPVS